MKPRRGARAEIKRTLTKEVKGKKPITREKNMTVKVPKAEELIGDGHANVSRTRTLKMGLPYGAAAISASCTVALTCNQDDKTIHKTAVLCTRIIEKLMEEDQKEMSEFIETMSDATD